MRSRFRQLSVLVFSFQALVVSAPAGGQETPDFAFSGLVSIYDKFDQIRPVVTNRSDRTVYFMSLHPRFAAFLERWNEQTERWEAGRRPRVCHTIVDVEKPIALAPGESQPLVTYWFYSIDQAEMVFKIGPAASRPANGRYRLVVSYSLEPWASGMKPSPESKRVAISPSFEVAIS